MRLRCAVAYPTKILFWKRITATWWSLVLKLALLLILQRYYFESESQHGVLVPIPTCAVAYPTKILFWKRITARWRRNELLWLLLLILQRYYFESESQHDIIDAEVVEAVAYPTKILFWKRITAQALYIVQDLTLLLILQRYYFESESQLKNEQAFIDSLLLLILQRYYFESESQRYLAGENKVLRCCLSYKDTILKANHSEKKPQVLNTCAVAYPTKILFWKRITAQALYIVQDLTLLLILQRYYFESESQLKNEQAFIDSLLLLILQRYYFESESQRYLAGENKVLRCCLSYKDTILKANHSEKKPQVLNTCAVAYPTKILFWKRITA